MFDWFLRKERIDVQVDIHSHLLPGLDDGVKTWEEAMEIVRFFSQMGYKRLITTPHIYPDHYPNTPEEIRPKIEYLRSQIQKEGIPIQVDAAAEYFVDAELIGALDEGREVLHFGDERYVLIETAFYTRSIMFDEAIFKIKSGGYVPVLAHPERYEYLEEDLSWLAEIRQKGVKLQVSIPSLSGRYGDKPKKVARELFKKGMVDFLGSDIHRSSQINLFREALREKTYPQDLLNNSLL